MARRCDSTWFRYLLPLAFLVACVMPVTAVLAQPAEDTPAATGEVAGEDKGTDAVDAKDDATQSNLSLDSIVNRHPEVKDVLKTLGQGEGKKALKELKALAAQHDDLPPGEVLLAIIYGAQKPPQAYQAAHRQALEDAILASPDDPDAYLMLAGVAVSQRRLAETDLLLNAAEKLVGSFAANADRKQSMQLRYHTIRALLHEHRKQWKEATAEWDSRLKLDDTAANVRYRYARSLFHTGTKEARGKALEEATKAYAQDDSVLKPYVAIALLYDENQSEDDPKTNAAKTKEWWVAAIQQYPKDSNTQLRYAQWLWKQGDAEGVIRHAQSAVDLDEENVDAKFLLGLAMKNAEELEKAEDLFVECQKLRPDSTAIRNHLALVRLDLGDATSTTMALSMARENFSKNQRDPFTTATLGYILFKIGQREQGINALKAVSRTRDSNIRFFLASVMVEVGDSEQAKAILKQVLMGKALFAYRSQAERLQSSLE